MRAKGAHKSSTIWSISFIPIIIHCSIFYLSPIFVSVHTNVHKHTIMQTWTIPFEIPMHSQMHLAIESSIIITSGTGLIDYGFIRVWLLFCCRPASVSDMRTGTLFAAKQEGWKTGEEDPRINRMSIWWSCLIRCYGMSISIQPDFRSVLFLSVVRWAVGCQA